MRIALTVAALSAALIVAGCGGGGTNSSPGGGSSSTQNGSNASETAIAATNSLGTPITALTNDNGVTSSLQSVSRTAQSVLLGACQTNASGGSYEFFSPDKINDANSTEQQYFYDSSCAQPARDIVRIWSSTGAASESVHRTVNIYAAGSSTASATRTETDLIGNATFDQYGFPVPANGFTRSSTGSLQYAGAVTIDADEELIMSPVSGGSEGFCSDAAGYNAGGIATLGETFGWSGGVSSGGSRTVNGDGSVTWSATHAGSSAKGPIGSLAIATGTANATCPIGTPMFTLTGGTTLGAYQIPVSATYKSGLLVGLTITNAVLASGNTLNVTTDTSASPTSSAFIAGTVANATATIATFTLDAFGDGTLTISSTGAQFVITDWHVVR